MILSRFIVCAARVGVSASAAFALLLGTRHVLFQSANLDHARRKLSLAIILAPVNARRHGRQKTADINGDASSPRLFRLSRPARPSFLRLACPSPPAPRPS